MKWLYFMILVVPWYTAACLQIENSTSRDHYKKGQSLSLTWKFNKTTEEEIISARLYMDRNYNVILAKLSGFTKTGESLLKKARNMTLEIKEQEYVKLILPSINYEDEHVYDLEALVIKGLGPSAETFATWSEIRVQNITGEPEFCNGKEISQIYSFPENTTPTIDVTICGNPKPQLSWNFNEKSTSIAGTLQDNKQQMYKYLIRIPSLHRRDCAKKMEFSIRGLSKTINITSTVLLQLKPTAPRISRATKANNWTSVAWSKEEIGDCVYNYTIIFTDDNNVVVAKINVTEQIAVVRKETTEEELNSGENKTSLDNNNEKITTTNSNIFTNATFVQVRATFQGIHGDLSERVEIVKEIPATTTTTTTRDPQTDNRSTKNTSRDKTKQKTMLAITVTSVILVLILSISMGCFIKRRCIEKSGFYSARKAENRFEEQTRIESVVDLVSTPCNHWNENKLYSNLNPDSIISGKGSQATDKPDSTEKTRTEKNEQHGKHKANYS